VLPEIAVGGGVEAAPQPDEQAALVESLQVLAGQALLVEVAGAEDPGPPHPFENPRLGTGGRLAGRVTNHRHFPTTADVRNTPPARGQGRPQQGRTESGTEK